jgi:hypothetical protein
MPAPFRGTYRQISDRGGHVRRGEHSTPVMFFNQHQVADTGSTRPCPVDLVGPAFPGGVGEPGPSCQPSMN